MVNLTPAEVDLLYRFSENPDIEIKEETLKKFIRAAREGFNSVMTLSLKHPITIRRICNIQGRPRHENN
ncbi:unnamed protein product [marine sediment metagenome]|uniref:Uncharacterized protein n=1 Tax=marine sediment metagenome TaxID=412755 RepID=X0W2E2_9ZZZZ